jgi:hypothetical protein
MVSAGVQPGGHGCENGAMRKKNSPRRLKGSAGSILSIGSSGSILSIGSTGSILSIGSAGSILSIGSAGSLASAFSVGSFASAGSILSGLSLCSFMAWRSRRLPDIPWLRSAQQEKALPAGAVEPTGIRLIRICPAGILHAGQMAHNRQPCMPGSGARCPLSRIAEISQLN